MNALTAPTPAPNEKPTEKHGGVARRSPEAALGLPTVIVIGNGMVGQHFCERAVERGLTRRVRLVVFGEELGPAYDRVNLGRVIEGSAVCSLTFRAPGWYEQHEIDARFAAAVSRIDRRRRVVEAGRREHRYDQLVLCTGSRARAPDVPGAELDGTLTYRTGRDALTLRRRALECRARGLGVVVVGGGLLGLEVADQLRSLRCDVVVVEHEAHLLPRQLDPEGGRLLAACLADHQLSFLLDQRVTAIERTAAGTLQVHAGDHPSVETGLVVFAMGVRPRDELARAAKLECDLFGGIEVDDGLATSDPRVFALGECARHRGLTYGLVAPGYQMAETLVDRLLGGSRSFERADDVTRLKTSRVELAAIGESAAHGMDVKSVAYRESGRYRRLTLRRNRIVGAAAIGNWPDLPGAQRAVARRSRLPWWEERWFRAGHAVWARAAQSLDDWPHDATVCTCTGVTCGTLRRAHADGCRSADELCQRTGAGSACGSCRPLLETLDASATKASSPRHRALWGIGIAALVGVVGVVLLGPVPYATSALEGSVDVLFRNVVYRQVTGFSLAFLMATSVLLTLRKRVSRFRWGSFARWRVLHSAVGLLLVAGVATHTGLRLGKNLDAWLTFFCLASVVIGSVAAFAAAMEARLPPGIGALVRGRCNRLHVYLLWPLPLLVTMHVVRFYYF